MEWQNRMVLPGTRAHQWERGAKKLSGKDCGMKKQTA